MKVVLLALCITYVIAQQMPAGGGMDPLPQQPGGVNDPQPAGGNDQMNQQPQNQPSGVGNDQTNQQPQNQPSGVGNDQTNQQPNNGYPQNQTPGAGYGQTNQQQNRGYPQNQPPGAGYDIMNQYPGGTYYPQNQLPHRNYPQIPHSHPGGYDATNQQPGRGYHPMNQQQGSGYHPMNTLPYFSSGFLQRMQMPSFSASPSENFFHSFQKHIDDHFLPRDHKCVKPYDLEEEMKNLSTSSDGYPEQAIATERSMRPDLSVYLPSAEPANDNDNNIDYSYSCPTVTKRLTSFQRYGGTCWLLADIPSINFGYCAQAYCKNHEYGSHIETRDMCLEHFDTVQVWAYCDNYNVANLRIKHESIKIPKYCRCKSVKCY